VKKRNVRLAT